MLYLVKSDPLPRPAAGFRPRYRPNVAIRAMQATVHGARWTVFAARIVYLRLCIWDLARYLQECDDDGLKYSLSLAEFHRKLDDMKARVVLLRAGCWA